MVKNIDYMVSPGRSAAKLGTFVEPLHPPRLAFETYGRDIGGTENRNKKSCRQRQLRE